MREYLMSTKCNQPHDIEECAEHAERLATMICYTNKLEARDHARNQNGSRERKCFSFISQQLTGQMNGALHTSTLTFLIPLTCWLNLWLLGRRGAVSLGYSCISSFGLLWSAEVHHIFPAAVELDGNVEPLAGRFGALL
jgi:hypothetical protein